jgi:transcriptional regulator with GAF, ATPase, and Fis domain
MAMSVWLHFLSHTVPGQVAILCAALEQAKVTVHALPERTSGPGIVLFEQVDAALLEVLRCASRHSTILAISLAKPVTATSDMWSILDAGASDILSWSAGSIQLDQILPRLMRWNAVQQLVESDAVRSCLVGNSAAWRALVRSVVEAATFTRSNVLITGETGTGKDLIAQLIHRLGTGSGELTVLDCTTLSPELAGSELFGHERGAFTGAVNARDGAFALADGGTLFLDEVGELPLPLQAQLLRAIQEHQYKRVGSNTWQASSFALICATNRDLEDDVTHGLFRADLYYRIAGWRCKPPPLRERRDDILPLAAHFLAQLASQTTSRQGFEATMCETAMRAAPERTPYDFDPAVREYLLTRDYPGNVRDLRQTVTRIWQRHSGPGPITIGAVPPDERMALHSAHAAWPDASFESAIRHALAMGINLPRISQSAADMAIRLVLEQEGDNNQRAALRLGVTDRALQIRRKARTSGGSTQPGETQPNEAQPREK